MVTVCRVSGNEKNVHRTVQRPDFLARISPIARFATMKIPLISPRSGFLRRSPVLLVLALSACNVFTSEINGGLASSAGGKQAKDSGDSAVPDGCTASTGRSDCPFVCTEVCDDEDNDCDGQTDEDLDPQACSLPHASSSCQGGGCVVTECNTGYGNCDDLDSNGCEEKLGSITACLNCSNDCSKLVAAATVVCGSTGCRILGCKKGYGDCDSEVENGCESSLLNSSDHCGACNTPCAAGTCQDGMCCDKSKYGNCDGSSANGCETPLNTLTNCGKCGQRCSITGAEASCSSGTCEFIKCNSDSKDCDGNTTNGCERLDTLINCGDCAKPCELPNAWMSCQNGTCEFVKCKAGFGDCDTNPANGCETSLTSTATCGGCNDKCEKAGCAGGKCSDKVCTTDFANCDGDGITCEESLNTPNNCVMCGVACVLDHANATCWNYDCEVESCDTGYDDCDGQAYNGCETHLSDDANHCGVCNHRCRDYDANAVTCDNGVCR
jgi:hypothetical protein